MQNSLIKDIIENLNQDIVCDEYIVEIEKIDRVENHDYKVVDKYIKLFKEKNIIIMKENVNKLNEILCTYSYDNEEVLKMDSLWYVNVKDKKLYFYSFQGFSEEFLYTYKKMKDFSFLRYLFDRYFEYNKEIKNVPDYISARLREYVNFLACSIGESIPSDNCIKNQQYSNNIYDDINYISTLTYEGSNVSAKIALLNKKFFIKHIDFYIKLKEPINFEEYRKVRKLLETSNKTTYLIGDNEKIHGLGRFKNISEFETNKVNALIIDFIGRFEYKINTLACKFNTVKEDVDNNTELKSYNLKEYNLVNIRYGKPDLKEHRYSENDFSVAIKSIFQEDFKDNIDKKLELLKKIVRYAKDQKHGTTVVITTPEKAKEEVSKLEKQSIRIDNKELEDNEYLANIINRITNIDGALYLDINGTCHAIGVILDGEADNAHGDASRGARFNSAIKYSLKKNLYNKCIVVVISEDGMINIIYNGDDYKIEDKKINELFNEAEKLYYNNEFEKAEENVEKILETDENNIKANLRKGLILSGQGRKEEAIVYCNKVIELDPTNATAYNNKGAYLLDLGKYEEVIDNCNRAIELDPYYALPYYNKGTALKKLQKYEEALECFDMSIKLKPDYSKAYNNKGNVLSRLGRYKQAIECFDKNIELDSKAKFAYNNKGLALAKLGKSEESLTCYNKAIEINPQYANAYKNKGDLLKKLGENEEANICFAKYDELKKQEND